MTTPSENKSVSETRNVLNPRIGIKRGFTLPVGDFASERLDISCEVDVASGVTIADSITDVNAVCEEFLGEERKKLQQRNPTSQTSPSVTRSTTSSPVSSSAPATSAENRPSASLSLDEAEIQRATWKPQAKSGDWTFAHEAPGLKEALERADKQTLVAVGYRFKLWQDNEGTARISRWPHKTD